MTRSDVSDYPRGYGYGYGISSGGLYPRGLWWPASVVWAEVSGAALGLPLFLSRGSCCLGFFCFSFSFNLFSYPLDPSTLLLLGLSNPVTLDAHGDESGGGLDGRCISLWCRWWWQWLALHSDFCGGRLDGLGNNVDLGRLK